MKLSSVVDASLVISCRTARSYTSYKGALDFPRSLNRHSNKNQSSSLRKASFQYQSKNKTRGLKMVDFTVFKGSKEGKIVKSTSHREIGPNEVLIKVTHSGLCGTDIHYKGADIVLGHEGAGVVEEIGKDVKTLKKGDRAGWGYVCCSFIDS